MGRLSHDLVTNILLCLPTKSVVRFRCLSKYYNKLVSDPWFATNHDLLSTPEVHGLFRIQGTDFKSDDSTLFCSFHSNTKIRTTKPKYYSLVDIGIITSCNGLLLLGESEFMLCVYNPIISPRFKNVIPEPGGLAFDTQLIKWNVGLAYDPIRFSSTEFRLVLIYGKRRTRMPEYGRYKSIFRFMIFSSTENSWRKCESVVELKYYNIQMPNEFLDLGQAVYSNGILHWFIKNNDGIITFDVEKEEAKLITMPPERELSWFLESRSYKSWFGAAKGLIYVIYVSGNEEIQMWVLVDYENSKWGAVRKKVVGLPRGASPIYFDGERIIFNCGLKNNKLRSFDMKLAEWKKMGRFPSGIRDESSHEVLYIPFIPTLASISSITFSRHEVSEVLDIARQIHKTLLPTKNMISKKRKRDGGFST